jgi:hypothetical protein
MSKPIGGITLEDENLMFEKPRTSSINPRYLYLLENEKPMTREFLDRVWGDWTPEEIKADEIFWRGYHEEQCQLEIEREARHEKDWE